MAFDVVRVHLEPPPKPSSLNRQFTNISKSSSNYLFSQEISYALTQLLRKLGGEKSCNFDSGTRGSCSRFAFLKIRAADFTFNKSGRAVKSIMHSKPILCFKY